MDKINKLIIGIDNDIYKLFAGYCKIKGVKIGDKLSSLLYDFLEEEKFFIKSKIKDDR